VSGPQIRFDDGSTYERSIGEWSRLVGERFLDWLALGPGLRWLDVGCGTGVFSGLVAERAAPAAVNGVDPSAQQLAFARQRLASGDFREGNAMALPYSGGAFDAAAMALVIAFVPVPAKGVEEMVRVVRPGGTIAAYMWDYGGALPHDPVPALAQAFGATFPRPPNTAVAELGTLRALWESAGLEKVEAVRFEVKRRFADFDDFWDATAAIASISPMLAQLSEAQLAKLKAQVRERVSDDPAGGVSRPASVNAVKGRVRP
jgi:SAM-dependent methyltransferase